MTELAASASPEGAALLKQKSTRAIAPFAAKPTGLAYKPSSSCTEEIGRKREGKIVDAVTGPIQVLGCPINPGNTELKFAVNKLKLPDDILADHRLRQSHKNGVGCYPLIKKLTPANKYG